jgi:hypothetical protein
MNTKLRKWIPIALCCLPGVAVAAIIGIVIALGGSVVGASLGGPLGIGLIVLAALACPLSMYLMMTRQRESSQQGTLSDSQMMVDCCAPGEEATSDRLESLRAQRESLERELAALQSSK